MSERELHEQDIRMECLRLAIQTESHSSRSIESARAYSDFVLGTNDAEVIRAARELAGKVKE